MEKGMSAKVVVVLSGGIDSTVLLYAMLGEHPEVLAISFDYGQRHRIELERAAEIARIANVDHMILNVRGLAAIFTGSALIAQSGQHVPHGHYEAESMRSTVVPNRNMIFLSIATAYAIRQGAQIVAYGAHAGDHAIYPDCRPEFAHAMKIAMLESNEQGVTLATPFIKWSKAEIVAYGDHLGAPLWLTWSCYEGNPPEHCGRCGTCVERKEAFTKAGVPDPTPYRE
jgi:7-cyano-7-deazaguanine synthase